MSLPPVLASKGILTVDGYWIHRNNISTQTETTIVTHDGKTYTK